jgi:hypothetical protein
LDTPFTVAWVMPITLSSDWAHRMSLPVFRGVFLLNLIVTEWDMPLNNIRLSIIFPKSFDPPTSKVSSGSSETTSLSECWNGTIAGQCNTLWQSALTVTVPINRLYFLPTITQLCVLIIRQFFFYFSSFVSFNFVGF